MVQMMQPLAKITKTVSKRMIKIPAVAKIATKVSRNKPEMFAIAGGALIIWAFVEAVKGGTKLQAVMAETADNVETMEKGQKARRELNTDENGNLIFAGGETALAALEKKELAKVRTEGTWKVAKMFALPSGLLVIGMVLIGNGFKILRTRNVILASTVEGLKKTMEFYRKNVREDLGEEADLKYLRGVIDNKEVETVVVDEDGKESKVKKRLPVVKEQKGNPWRFEFSDTYFWSYEEDTDRNLFFLKCEEDWWNRELDRNEEVSMYEILKHLQFKFDVLKAQCGSAQEYRDKMTFLRNYGWRKGCGDGFVDFGLYRAINEPAITRKSDVVFIEFNCSGNLQNLSVKNYTK